MRDGVEIAGSAGRARMPPHVISTCAACAGDVRNAGDRCQPIGQSRTAPCGASHFQPRESLRPWEPKVRSKKKFSPPAKRHALVRPHRVGCWGARWFSQSRPDGLTMAATRCARGRRDTFTLRGRGGAPRPPLMGPRNSVVSVRGLSCVARPRPRPLGVLRPVRTGARRCAFLTFS